MKRPDSQSKQKWIEIIDKGLLGVWNTRGISYFFTGKYIGDKTATLIFTKDKTSVDYHYKIDLEGANEDVILSIIHQEKVISIYKIVDIVIHQKQKELTLVDSLGKEIHFISQSYIYR